VPGATTVSPAALSLSVAVLPVVPFQASVAFSVSPVFPSVTLHLSLVPAVLSVSPVFPDALADRILGVPTLPLTLNLPNESVKKGVATVLPAALAMAIYFPTADVTGADHWAYGGVIVEPIDPSLYPAGVQFRLVAWITTADSGTPVKAYLYNYNQGAKVEASVASGTVEHITTPGTEAVPATVGAWFTPPVSGMPLSAADYAVEYGGATGGDFVWHGALLEWKA